MRNIESGSPEIVKIAELSGAELAAPSGIYDPRAGKDLTTFAAIELIEQATGSQGVILNSNGHLSAEAARHNSELNRRYAQTVETMIFAVISKRPPRV